MSAKANEWRAAARAEALSRKAFRRRARRWPQKDDDIGY